MEGICFVRFKIYVLQFIPTDHWNMDCCAYAIVWMLDVSYANFNWQILWGPLSYLTAICITKSSPFRHTVQALVSTGELYGNLLYLTTSLLDEYVTGRRYYRPEPLYFWAYFVLMNSIWLFVPGCKNYFRGWLYFANIWYPVALYDSIMASARSFGYSDPPKRAKKSKDDGSKKEKEYRKVPASQDGDTRSRRGKAKSYNDDYSNWTRWTMISKTAVSRPGLERVPPTQNMLCHDSRMYAICSDWAKFPG